MMIRKRTKRHEQDFFKEEKDEEENVVADPGMVAERGCLQDNHDSRQAPGKRKWRVKEKWPHQTVAEPRGDAAM